MTNGRVPERSFSFDEAMLHYDWPKNVRELKALAERAVQLIPEDGRFTVDVLDEPIRGCVPQHKEERGTLGRGSPSRERIERALRATGGNVSKAAEKNGWQRTQLNRWIQRIGLDLSKYRA
jgi:DNA-binding NtrC family response regulator